jgi:hypothetical protein
MTTINIMISLLRQVQVQDLQPGKKYLIQEKRPEYQHMKFKGTFVKNDYPPHPHYTTMTHFNDVVGRENHPQGDLKLQEAYWNYYEADARIRAWTTFVMREITGDPSFTPYM